MSCCYLYATIHNVVELVAQQIYHAFPDRNDRRLVVGDATPWNKHVSCPNHPGDSHMGWENFDLDYYTFQTNSTQYGDDKTDIWNRLGYELKEDVFDWERNFWCYFLLKRYMNARIRVNWEIREFIADNVRREYGSDMYREFTKEIIPKYPQDEGTAFNHHIHAHVYGHKDLNDVSIIQIGGIP